MFNKWVSGGEGARIDDNGKNGDQEKKTDENGGNHSVTSAPPPAVNEAKINTILKGSKLTGDINVTCDLELSGDVEGNIKSAKDSSIVIRGTCKGNIETIEGSVDIAGELKGGNIIAGKNVTITGKFSGGEVKAKSKIYVNGEFDGKLEGNEVEIGSGARGKGEIFYSEYISISKGAGVEVRISRIQQGERKTGRTSPEKKTDAAEKNTAEMKAPPDKTDNAK